MNLPPHCEPAELEQQILITAQDLTQDQWQSILWNEFQQALLYGEEEEWEFFDEELAEIQAELEAVWDEYSQTQISEDELTLETALGHQILQDGLQYWADALEELRLAAEDNGSVEEALELAESGSRLLAVLSWFADQQSLTNNELRRAS